MDHLLSSGLIIVFFVDFTSVTVYRGGAGIVITCVWVCPSVRECLYRCQSNLVGMWGGGIEPVGKERPSRSGEIVMLNLI